MLKVVDLDYLDDYTLELTFNDGFSGVADLTTIFTANPVKDFKSFSLTQEGSLNWDNLELSAEELRRLTQGSFLEPFNKHKLSSIEEIIKQASWESMEEGRPDILQAAIRAYVEYYGHSKVVKKAGIKSRTSAYKTLNPNTKPSFATLVQLGNAVIEIAKTEPITAIPQS